MWRALSLAALSSGCASDVDPEEATPAARILGQDDSVLVQRDDPRLTPAMRAVLGAIGRGQGLACTGTHVGERLVLTAGHCIEASSLSECRATAFEWNVSDEASARLTGVCERVLFLELSETRDLALIEVDRAPALAARVDLEATLASGSALAILGYPERSALRWSGECQVAAIAEGALLHNCDTDSGSSGSPLIDPTTGAVVGVHTGADGVATNRAEYLGRAVADRGEACEECSGSLALLRDVQEREKGRS